MAREKKLSKEESKSLNQYKPSHPEQLSLFELLSPQHKPYSNSIELYDFMPKYYWGKATREKAEKSKREVLPDLVKDFECRGGRYTMRLKPASVTGKDGWTYDCYPGQREELVEDALRKLAVDGQGVFLSDDRSEAASVIFTLYQLQKELKSRGHSYSKDEIKEALFICAGTTMEIATEDGSAVIKSHIFETLGLQTSEGWKGTGEKTRCFVRFNPLVTRAIKSGAFRRLNYDKAMSYGLIARQLFKRLSHHYTQASLMNRYTVMLTTLIRDFGLTQRKQLRDNLREVQAALEEMKKKGDVLFYEIESVIDTKQRNKLIDAKITLATAPNFNTEAIEANQQRASGQLLSPSMTKK